MLLGGSCAGSPPGRDRQAGRTTDTAPRLDHRRLGCRCAVARRAGSGQSRRPAQRRCAMTVAANRWTATPPPSSPRSSPAPPADHQHSAVRCRARARTGRRTSNPASGLLRATATPMWFDGVAGLMSMVELPRVIPDQPGRPEWGDAARPMQELTPAISLDRDVWTPERLAQIRSLFDSGASAGTPRRTERHDALMDALTRGRPFPSGWCVEVGSGTGNATADLQQAFRDVVSLDLSQEMLRVASFGVVRSEPILSSTVAHRLGGRCRAHQHVLVSGRDLALFWPMTACCCGSARMARSRPSTSHLRMC